MIVFDRDGALRAALSSGRNRPGSLVDFFFAWNFVPKEGMEVISWQRTIPTTLNPA
jgi:hypothetical protein